MEIKLSGKDFDKITVRDLTKNYKDDGETGVSGYNGKLIIRPAYQREFVYNDKERNLVIQTIRKGFPLNTMYWVLADSGNFELMDGQQRTISICRFVNKEFSIDWDGTPRGFDNLTSTEQDKILDYELTIYQCEGTKEERISWFKVINIAGKALTNQEIRNAIYTGDWLMDAKRYFSKAGCPALKIGKKLMTGRNADRQEVLEIALKWISHGKIEEYMQVHQQDPDADELWQYFQEVIAWAERTFPTDDSSRIKLMKGLEWGKFFNNYKNEKFNSQELNLKIEKLIIDNEIRNKKGIYEYLLSGDESHLNLRIFEEDVKIEIYNKQKGVCVAKNATCGNKQFEFEEMEADHIIPWSKGGKTEPENCQMLCKKCNKVKSDK